MSILNDVLLRYLGRTVDKPDIPETRCLGLKFPAYRCHACRDACPQGALDRNLKKYHRSCRECGLCAAGCPVSAIDSPRPVFSLYHTMRRHREKEQILRLACRATEQEIYPASIAVPCLAALPPPVLLLPSLLGFREVWLHHGHCPACPLEKEGRLAFRLQYHFARALRLAAQLPEFSLTLADSPPASFASRWGQLTGYSRRDFLSLLGRETKHTGMSGACLVSDLFADEEHTAGDSGLSPPDRLLWEKLLSAFSALPQAGEALPFAFLEISAACDMCRACTVLCPGRALSVRENDATVSLVHRPAACFSCGVCARFCPHRAITLSPWQGSDWQERVLHIRQTDSQGDDPLPEPVPEPD
jgi:ferredoxin